MAYNINIKEKAILLRKQGQSIGEISKAVKIAKSTASVWTSKIAIDQLAIDILNSKKLKAWQSGLQVLKQKRDHYKNEVAEVTKLELSKINFTKPIYKLICSIFIWTEGSKLTGRYVGFMNSDPAMVSTFLSLIRKSFPLDESKFRGLVHIHEYHDDPEIKSFWIQLTKIPSSQFNKSYVKPHTGKRIREGYKGCLSIRYYDYKIALELKATYNQFAQSLGV